MKRTVKRNHAHSSRRSRTMTRTRKHSIIKSGIPARDKDIQATIDIQAVKHNLKVLKSHAKTDIMPVLKADAYGHGLLEMSKTVRKLGVKYIGVATLGEAIYLRNNGDKGRILAWLFDIDGSEVKDAMHLNLDIAICDETIIPQFIKMIPSGKKIKVTMFVDTGINRAGITYANALEAFKTVNQCDKIELVGMMSHLIDSQNKNSPLVKEQLRKFRDLRQRLADINIIPPLVHIANTRACFNYDVSDFTLSRSGGGIYGMPSDKREPRLKLAMSMSSYIIQLKDVKKGEGIGYDWTYKAPRDMRIAIVPIGYADIIPRKASNNMYLYINGAKRKLLGLISMDQIVVEATKTDKLNDVVYIFGNGKNCPQTIYDVARQGEASPYEVMCHTGYRVNRTYK
jgi:alanine racemase